MTWNENSKKKILYNIYSFNIWKAALSEYEKERN